MRVRGISVDVAIDVPRLARRSPALAGLRRELAARAGGDVARVDRFLQGRLEDALTAFGEAFVAETSPVIMRIAGLRERLTALYDRVLAGRQELPADVLRDLFDQLERELGALRTPTQYAQANGLALPPRPSAPSARTPDPDRRARIAHALAGRLRNLRDIVDARGRDALLDAAELEAAAVRAVVVAETDTGLVRAVEGLRDALEARGWGRDRIDRCVRAARRIHAAQLRARERAAAAARKADVEAAVARLGPELTPFGTDLAALAPDLAVLVRRSRFLQQFIPGGEVLLARLLASYREGRSRTGKRRLRSPTFEIYVLVLQRLYRGQHGEFEAAWRLGRDFVVLKAPDAKPTIRGTDLVVVSLTTGEVWFVDNKAFQGDRPVQDVSALIRNFPRNLLEDAVAFAGTLGEETHPVLQDALNRITAAALEISELADEPDSPARDARIEAILKPLRIARVVTTAQGRSSGISDAVAASGLQHVDVNAPTPLLDDPEEVTVP